MYRIPYRVALAHCRSSSRRLYRYLKSRRFPPKEELLFQGFYADRAYPKARFGVALGLIAWIAFGVWDGLGFPEILPRLGMVRLGLIAPPLAGLWWFIASYPERFKAWMQAYLSAALAAVVVGLLLMMALASETQPQRAFLQYWPAFTGLCFFQYACLGMKCRYAAVLGLGSLGLVWGAGVAAGVANPVLGSALFQLLMVNLLGMVVCARQEIHERTLFRLKQHYLRQMRAAHEERLNARLARDHALLERARADTARLLSRTAERKLAAFLGEKERFFSAAYHDLQQPLSIIGLYVRAAKSKLETSSTAAIRADLGIIEGAGQDIALMLKGVRDAWEIGGAEPNIEPVDLGAVLGEIERELRERAEQKHLEFRLREGTRAPAWVLSDRILLKRALSNLAGNAIKYTERGGVVMGAVLLNSRVRVDVRDTGLGIPPEFQGRIFDEYFQVRKSGEIRGQGLGLGLAIVRRIVANLPGHGLSFHSKPGRGSRFSLVLPVAFGSALNPAGQSRTALLDTALDGKYVVIVEDERALLEGLVQMIRGAGGIAEGVESAAAARALFAERDRCPDILLADWRLGFEETGRDAVAALRERFEWAGEVPVLFITGEMAPLEGLADFEGPFEIYHKPIDPDTLLDGMWKLITRLPERSRP